MELDFDIPNDPSGLSCMKCRSLFFLLALPLSPYATAVPRSLVAPAALAECWRCSEPSTGKPSAPPGLASEVKLSPFGDKVLLRYVEKWGMPPRGRIARVQLIENRPISRFCLV